MDLTLKIIKSLYFFRQTILFLGMVIIILKNSLPSVNISEPIHIQIQSYLKRFADQMVWWLKQKTHY